MGFINTYVNGCIPPQNSFNYYNSNCTPGNPTGLVPGSSSVSYQQLTAYWTQAYALLESNIDALSAAIQSGSGTAISTKATSLQSKLTSVVSTIASESGLVVRGFVQASDYSFTYGTSSTTVAATSNSSYSVGSSPQVRAEVIEAFTDPSVLAPGYRFSSSDKSTNAYIAGGVGGTAASNGCQNVPILVFRLAFNIVSA